MRVLYPVYGCGLTSSGQEVWNRHSRSCFIYTLVMLQQGVLASPEPGPLRHKAVLLLRSRLALCSVRMCPARLALACAMCLLTSLPWLSRLGGCCCSHHKRATAHVGHRQRQQCNFRTLTSRVTQAACEAPVSGGSLEIQQHSSVSACWTVERASLPALPPSPAPKVAC